MLHNVFQTKLDMQAGHKIGFFPKANTIGYFQNANCYLQGMQYNSAELLKQLADYK